MKKLLPDILWPVLIVLSIFFASGQSEIATPGFSFSLDKVAHVGVFGALATSLIRLNYFYRREWKGALQVWLLIALYGALDEYRQSFTPGRSVEFDDWLADILGAALAVSLYKAWPWYRRLLETNVKPPIP
jgi:VanZ family protein